jgi:hypothetical protein
MGELYFVTKPDEPLVTETDGHYNQRVTAPRSVQREIAQLPQPA